MLIIRKGPRHPSQAQARVIGLMNNAGMLKDIDILGCRIETTVQVDVWEGQTYKIEVIPEKDSRIGKFSLSAEARWVKRGEYSCEMGFLIIASPQGRDFQRYVDYLALKNK
jgi:hypothetical protein